MLGLFLLYYVYIFVGRNILEGTENMSSECETEIASFSQF